ncbi:MAG: lysophospholipid acyltransferase family protein [Candidatus Eremiobacteraeota bacterium]|nr:lysophospholipid acyltransferase family protein [Candidatus Eremiobacteraeota bacterium]
MNGEPHWLTAHRIRGFPSAFERYVRWLVRRSFATVWIHRDAERLPPSGYVAAANHSSWWDGFIPFLLHRQQRPDSPFAIMMHDAELRRFPIFRWAGAFSVDSRSPRTGRASIYYAGDEARNGAGVWIFPQGRFQRNARAEDFSSGFVHAARRAGVPIAPVAMQFLMTEKQRPEAFVDIAPTVDASLRDARVRTAAAIDERLQRIAAIVESGTVASHFFPLFAGVAGVDNGVATLLKPLRRWL